jgi:hypothetical protein
MAAGRNAALNEVNLRLLRPLAPATCLTSPFALNWVRLQWGRCESLAQSLYPRLAPGVGTFRAGVTPAKAGTTGWHDQAQIRTARLTFSGDSAGGRSAYEVSLDFERFHSLMSASDVLAHGHHFHNVQCGRAPIPKSASMRF